MKKVFVVIITVLIVATTCLQAQAGRRHYRNNDGAEALAGFVVGTLFGAAISSGNRVGYDRRIYHSRRGYYGYGGYGYRQSEAAMREIERQERNLKQYYDCLDRNQIKLQYGANPRDLRECRRRY